MGLIAREAERRGIPSISLSSARSITASANPPRALYLDFPLGRTAGRAGDVEMQRDIMRRALTVLAEASGPGEIVDLPYRWADSDDWKDGVMRPKQSKGGVASGGHEDDRIERYDTPQYQTDEDEALADANCATCVWLQDERR